MGSKLENLSSEIIVGELVNGDHLADLVTVLSEYRIDDMGASVPYNDQEVIDLKRRLLEQKSIEVFLLYVNKQIAGGSVCFRSMSTFSTKNIVNIHDICILKDFRGNGFGRKLMTHIIDYAKELNCSKVTLEVREDNVAARKLYRSLMFSESTPVMNFWSKTLACSR